MVIKKGKINISEVLVRFGHVLCKDDGDRVKQYWLHFFQIWLKCSEDSRIEFARLISHAVLLFTNFSSFKLDTKNNVNFDAVSSKCTDFDEVHF